MSEDFTVVSHEQDGRILSGAGADVDALAETMDRHTPEDKQVEPPAPEPKAPEAAAPVVTGEVVPEKPQTRGQKRFADLTREREDARREAAALRAEVESLKARPPSPAPAPAAPPAPERTAVAPTPTRTKPTEDEIGTKYQTYADFVEDLADWKVEQRDSKTDFDARIRTAIEADRASRSFTEKVTSVLDAGRKAYADFDAVRVTSQIQLPKSLIDTVLEMENAHDVIYRLAKDADLTTRIAQSDPYQAGLLLATLKPTVPDARPASSVQPSVPPPPAPYQPVQGGRPTTVTPSADLANAGDFDFDKSGYREKRAAERGVRRR